MEKNLFSVKKTVPRSKKEQLLKQRALALWLCGLSGSGKSTIANILETKLNERGNYTIFVDGDDLRLGLNSDLDFSEISRNENIRRASELAKIFVNNGAITINCFISPTEETRSISKNILKDDLFEVYIKCSLEICEDRDPKGLYKKARNGEIKYFTGISAPFIAPLNPNLIIDTEQVTPEDAADLILKNILPLISI